MLIIAWLKHNTDNSLYTASLSDFSIAQGALTFTASDLSTHQECSVVSATSDVIFEDDETFTVILNPPSEVTISGRSSTTVTIPANGGQWNLFMHDDCKQSDYTLSFYYRCYHTND